MAVKEGMDVSFSIDGKTTRKQKELQPVKSQLRKEEYKQFPQIANPYHLRRKSKMSQYEGLQKLVMLDRYSLRDDSLTTLKDGDTVVLEILYDPKYPTQGFGEVTSINEDGTVTVKVEFPEAVSNPDGTDIDLDNFVQTLDKVVKPLELYWEQICYRAARGVASVEKTRGLRRYWFKKFYWMLANKLAVPGGRILYGAGSDNDVTLFNCFVLDHIEDSRRGISRHRETTMEIMSRGGGVGSNGSALRPKGAFVRGVNGKSSGSVSWLNDLARLTELVQQGGSRRGAQMIGLMDFHPDIISFILSKVQNPQILNKIIDEVDNQWIKTTAEFYLVRDKDGNPSGVTDKTFLTGANISTLLTHDFMEAVESDADWDLKFPDIENFTKEESKFYDEHWAEMGDIRKWEAAGMPVKVYHTLKARALWDLINICARYSAEPGVIFIDECNDKSNSWYYAPLVVTNPCGEQPLPPFAVCNLIAINLQLMYDKYRGGINYPLLKKVTHISQRFADNVIDHSFYFLPENEKMAKAERRIGKGVMGLADLMIDLKLPYGSDEMIDVTDKLFSFIKEESYLASANLAEEKGSFEYYNEELFLQSGFMQTMPKHVVDVIKEKGIRHVCSLTVAPTGSTGTMVGVATGLEPYFSFTYFRSGRLGKFIEVNTAIAEKYFMEHPGATELPNYYVGAMDIGPLEHAKVQSTIQKHVDSAISKTCNAPEGFTVEQNKELYIAAWKGGCKGVTVYVDKSRDSQVLSLDTKENSFVEEEQTESVIEEPTNTVSETVAKKAVIETESTKLCVISYDNLGNKIVECH